MAAKTLRATLQVSAFLALAFTPAQGQLEVWAGATYAEALDGQWGGDARLSYTFPALPVSVFAGGDYFLADCDEECSLWGWRFGGNLRVPFLGLTPYASGAWVNRKWESGDRIAEKEGLALGVGLSLGLGLRVQVEASREFLGGDLDQWLLRASLGF